MTQYCIPADCYRFVPPGMLQVPARLVAAVNATANLLTLQGHGLTTGDPLSFRAESGGSLPSPIMADTTYYAIVVSPDTFQVSTSVGGSAVDLTTAGSNVKAIPQMPWDRWIDECSASLEQTVVAHTVPLLNLDGSIPVPVREYTAALLAIRALAFCGRETVAVQELLPHYSKQADKWARGVPIRGTKTPTAANCAVVGNGRGADPRGWDPRPGRLP